MSMSDDEAMELHNVVAPPKRIRLVRTCTIVRKRKPALIE